ncbi:hypothetical protein Cs7R123_66700 [Catellatospora sp. TT07R-123]|uniref:hypothetical protein n=1 Tax=Catellatospora sp. TT07R-123 TaxID=2733863 RepID=UPI001B1B2FBE|nr:hypothetical protein [Catellatospora sp. TT07R-123]GHJ49328.1 hypothetical protein Cs7R123_66700 [Catellatospora sp. TT07R-123]
MRIAITGHTKLPVDTLTLVDLALRDELAQHATPALVGVSLLADGPDQLFAHAVLDLGGRLEAIAVQPEHRHFDQEPFAALLARAAAVDHLPLYPTPAQAWTAGAEELLRGADLLIAIWDGSDPAGNGGTADVVVRARVLGVPVRVLWPSGAKRR